MVHCLFVQFAYVFIQLIVDYGIFIGMDQLYHRSNIYIINVYIIQLKSSNRAPLCSYLLTF